MTNICYFYPKDHELHFAPNHPERPARVEAIRQIIEEAMLWDPYPKLNPVDIPIPVLTAIHTEEHLEKLKDTATFPKMIDGDTYTTPKSWELALNAAGGACAIADAVWTKQANNGFSLSRPPGHHATSNVAMGFCLLNNIALAAEYLIQQHELKKIAIIDLDVHHGNGTQDIFYTRNDVFFYSIHQSPLYPGTGHLHETGEQEGNGFTLNLPLPPFSGDEARQASLDQIILPSLLTYQPEIILISAGFDAHWADPLAHQLSTAQGYGEIIKQLNQFADTHCDGKIALFLEGGYDLNGGAASALACIQALLDHPITDQIGPAKKLESSDWQSIIDECKTIWNL